MEVSSNHLINMSSAVQQPMIMIESGLDFCYSDTLIRPYSGLAV